MSKTTTSGKTSNHPRPMTAGEIERAERQLGGRAVRTSKPERPAFSAAGLNDEVEARASGVGDFSTCFAGPNVLHGYRR